MFRLKKKHPSSLKDDKRTFTAWQSHFAVICWRGCIQSGCVTDFCLSLFRLIETAGESPKSRRSNPGQRRVWFVLCLAFNAAGAVCWCVLGCLFNASRKKRRSEITAEHGSFRSLYLLGLKEKNAAIQREAGCSKTDKLKTPS